MNRITNLFQNKAIAWISVFLILVAYWTIVNIAM